MRILIIFILFFFPLATLSENTIGLVVDERYQAHNLKFYTTTQVLEHRTKVYIICGIENYCVNVIDIPNKLISERSNRIISEKPIYEFTLNPNEGEEYNQLSFAWINNEEVYFNSDDFIFPDGSSYTSCTNDVNGEKYTYKNAKGEETYLYYDYYDNSRNVDKQCLASNQIFTLNHLEKSKYYLHLNRQKVLQRLLNQRL